MGSKSGNVYKTPEDMAAWIAEESGTAVDPKTVRKIALEGNLINEDGEIGFYEFLAYMAVFVK